MWKGVDIDKYMPNWHQIERIERMSETEKKINQEIAAVLAEKHGLQQLFKRYNDFYFDGQLPSISVKWSRSLRKLRGAVGEFQSYKRTKLPKVIRVSTMLRRHQNAAAHILLHEMVHLALWQRKQRAGHGPEFSRERLELAMKGAYNGLWRKSPPAGSSREQLLRWIASDEHEIRGLEWGGRHTALTSALV